MARFYCLRVLCSLCDFTNAVSAPKNLAYKAPQQSSKYLATLLSGKKRFSLCCKNKPTKTKNIIPKLFELGQNPAELYFIDLLLRKSKFLPVYVCVCVCVRYCSISSIKSEKFSLVILIIMKINKHNKNEPIENEAQRNISNVYKYKVV